MQAIEDVAMKLLKRCLVIGGILCVIMAIFVGVAYLSGVLINIQSATIGIACSHLRTVGRAITRGLRECNAFPRDCSPVDTSHPARLLSQRRVLLDVEQLLHKYGRGTVDADIPRDYLSPDIWSVVKNLPDDPPSNLVVLVTRNVDSSSLRTRLTDRDMHKQIRFKGVKDDFWILNRFAVLVRLDGTAITVRVKPMDSRKSRGLTYKNIYRGVPFDVTTNNIQVKYLAPDGEVGPNND